MRVNELRHGWMKWLAAASLAAAAAVAWAAVTMNATSGTIGTNVAFSGFEFDPGTKAPKAVLVPAGGGKSVKLTVFAFDSTRIDAQVVKGLAGDYGVVITPADRSVAPVTVEGTFTIVLPAPASIEPATGPVKVPVVILGDSFGDRKGKVTIGGKKAGVTRWASDRVECVVPKKLAAGAHPVVVLGKAGASVAALSFTVTADGGGGGGEFMRLDVGSIHLEGTQRGLYFGASHNVSQGFAGFSVSRPPNGNPSLMMNINGPNFATPTPFDVLTGPTAAGSLTCVFSDGAGSIYQAVAQSDFKFTITSSSGGVVAGTFGGTMTKVVGPGAATVTVTNGEVRAELTIVGQ